MSSSTVEVSCESFTRFKPICSPTSIPVGIKGMIDEPHHQIICLPGQMSTYAQDAVIITGSGYHILNGFSPTPCGVVPDIGKNLKKEGRIGRFMVAETIEGVKQAKSVKIRKNPLCAREKTLRSEMAGMSSQDQGFSDKKEELRSILEQKEKQLEAEKEKTITWLLSLSKTPDDTYLCAVRNTFTCGTNTQTKPVWCTGVGKQWIMDFGSGKAVLVDGKTGCQHGEYFEYDFEEFVTDSTSLAPLAAKIIHQFEDAEDAELDFSDVACFATGKWREHPETFKALQFEITKKGLQCDLLTPEKEALFGSTSTLTILAPYFPEVNTFLTIELGGGSTQYRMFNRIA